MGVVSFKDFTWTYSGSRKPILKKIKLDIREGEFHGLIGGVGSGRTTLSMTILGLVPHMYPGTFKGGVVVDGLNVEESSISQLSTRVGLVMQSPETQLTGAGTSVEEELAFGLENLGVPREEMRKRVNEMVELIGLESFRHRSPFELSGGQQQKVAIASVLIMEPKIIVLDEPTAQLDPLGTRQVFNLVDKLKNKGITVLLNTQKVEYLAEFADRVTILKDGEVKRTGKTREILTNVKLLEKHGIRPTVFTELCRALKEKKVYEGDDWLTLSDAQKGLEEVKKK